MFIWLFARRTVEGATAAVQIAQRKLSYLHGRRAVNHAFDYLHGGCRVGKSCIWLFAQQIKFAAPGKRLPYEKKKKCFPPRPKNQECQSVVTLIIIIIIIIIIS